MDPPDPRPRESEGGFSRVSSSGHHVAHNQLPHPQGPGAMGNAVYYQKLGNVQPIISRAVQPTNHKAVQPFPVTQVQVMQPITHMAMQPISYIGHIVVPPTTLQAILGTPIGTIPQLFLAVRLIPLVLAQWMVVR